MGDGIYLRYNSSPGGLDIYDFSDSSKPICLYESDGEVSEDSIFEYENYVYNENTFGILKVIRNGGLEDQNYKLTWQIYSLDISSSKPFKLLEEYPIIGIDPLIIEP